MNLKLTSKPIKAIFCIKHYAKGKQKETNSCKNYKCPLAENNCYKQMTEKKNCREHFLQFNKFFEKFDYSSILICSNLIRVFICKQIEIVVHIF